MWWSLIFLLPYLIGCCIFILVIAFIKPKGVVPPTYVYPAISGGLLGVAAIYYALCFGSPKHSIIRLAGVKVEVKSMCHGRHQRFGFKYRVFIIPNNNSPMGHIARVLRWCFGWTLDSPLERVEMTICG